MFRNTWVFSRRLDKLLFILPFFVGLGFILALDAGGKLQDPFYGWFYLIVYVLLDVPHVFATVFRTYLDPEYVGENKRLLILAPLAILISVPLGTNSMVRLRSSAIELPSAPTAWVK